MKKLKKIFYTLFVILITFISTNAQKDSLLNCRIVLLDSLSTYIGNTSKQFDWRIELAVNYIEAKKYENSLAELNKIPIYFADSAKQRKIIFYQALNFYLLNDYAQSLQKIALWKTTTNDSLEKNIQLIKILSLNQQVLFDSAQKICNLYIKKYALSAQLEDSLSILVKKLYKHKPKVKSEEKAQWIATFIPGGGIIYGGKLFEGLFSFSLQAASLGYALLEFFNHNYITGYVIGLGLLQKFYFGSLKRTSFITIQKNSEKIYTFNAKLLMIIRSI